MKLTEYIDDYSIIDMNLFQKTSALAISFHHLSIVMNYLCLYRGRFRGKMKRVLKFVLNYVLRREIGR